ncbi:MAG: 23S rRNA (adenine(2503)-C(2))-methyltransferase RlmN [Eubacteriales bacterium]|nr:23S rRNA (adenine(2503)-C(2))-methyltransferase RlmN [Eubacteriales bacterium]
MADKREARIELLSMNEQELMDFVVNDLGESKFRAGQIRQWLNRGVEISEMSNLSNALRTRLSEMAVANPVRIRESYKSKIDETEKFLYELHDGNLIEGVVMRYKYGDTLCVSTQVGCRMGCAFCASTLEGRVRNLSAGEILGQVVAANRHIQAQDAERRIHNIVLMGSGEPFDNYESVVKFLRLVNSPTGLNISIRNISLSTCGLVNRIDDFIREGLPVTLSLSLHAPNDSIRQKIMPVANAYAYEDVIAACRRYSEATGRRVVFEYALIKNVNCEVRHAEELARRLRGMRCHVNLIPLNAVKERNLEAPTKQDVAAFLKRLELKNISATVRREMGADIDGACGQLRRKYISEQK